MYQRASFPPHLQPSDEIDEGILFNTTATLYHLDNNLNPGSWVLEAMEELLTKLYIYFLPVVPLYLIQDLFYISL
ncbi:hypothetical protein GDO81_000890 [Engystomops pustulosus]|uniref:Uncharacterized protein n=1 Tax=Engystomops pustulosus TaxID=76066 RepID=A0AAV7D9U7_ENGPU|nr:hypothetical protein GDO81_000890 [Engystomops pustulosus]